MLILKANVLLLGWIEAERQQQQKLQTMARELSARRTEHYVNKFNILLTTKRSRMAHSFFSHPTQITMVNKYGDDGKG